MRELIPTIDSWLDAGERVALATVVSTWGSTPRPMGSHMIVSSDGRMAGSVSGGCVEGAVVEAALEVLSEGRPRMLEFGVADELAWNVGLACGGNIRVWVEELPGGGLYRELRERLLSGSSAVVSTAIEGPRTGEKRLLSEQDELSRAALERGRPAVEEVGEDKVFVQPYLPPSRLVIVGAVHTAIPLVSLAHVLDYRVTVVDARSAFATKERFPDADELIVSWPDEALDRLRPDRSTAVVVLTHDPKFDEPALDAALRSDAGYIGAIGSRHTSSDRLMRLRARGWTSEQLARIHGPIGLDLGGDTPAETALAIMAEIVAAIHGRSGQKLSEVRRA